MSACAICAACDIACSAVLIRVVLHALHLFQMRELFPCHSLTHLTSRRHELLKLLRVEQGSHGHAPQAGYDVHGQCVTVNLFAKCFMHGQSGDHDAWLSCFDSRKQRHELFCERVLVQEGYHVVERDERVDFYAQDLGLGEQDCYFREQDFLDVAVFKYFAQTWHLLERPLLDHGLLCLKGRVEQGCDSCDRERIANVSRMGSRCTRSVRTYLL